jgi:predicted nucleotidyltransferase
MGPEVVAEPVVAIVREYLERLRQNGLHAQFAVVFGSHASGRAEHWSDIDLLVVSPEFDATRDRRQVDLLWRLAARTDSRLEPVPCGARQWEEDQTSVIVEVARREGERI